MAEPYVCILDEASLAKASKELNEIPSDREAAIEALKNWVKEQPHLKVPNDAADFEYLMILRGAKFSQLRAREILEGNIKAKFESPDWFHRIDTHDPKIEAILDDGFILRLPKRTKEGCQILMYRIGCLDPNMKRYSPSDTLKTGIVVVSSLLRNELTQIHGVVFIVDFTGMTAKHMANQLRSSEVQNFEKRWQKNSPGRFKAFHFYNAGVFLEALLLFYKPFMQKKLYNRIVTHDTLESLYRYVPEYLLPAEYLPDDYTGPSAGTVKDIIDELKIEIKRPEYREEIMEMTDKHKVSYDESKRPKDREMAQSFRKLVVD